MYMVFLNHAEKINRKQRLQCIIFFIFINRKYEDCSKLNVSELNIILFLDYFKFSDIYVNVQSRRKYCSINNYIKNLFFKCHKNI